MGPKPSQPESDELLSTAGRAGQQPLVKLAALIDWPEIERSFAASLSSAHGRPGLPPWPIAGPLYLQYTFDASDEAVLNSWVEYPYSQFFCGETYLQTELPMDPSSLTR